MACDKFILSAERSPALCFFHAIKSPGVKLLFIFSDRSRKADLDPEMHPDFKVLGSFKSSNKNAQLCCFEGQDCV